MANPPFQPEFQRTIFSLYGLFVEYTRARSPERRAELESRILGLFEALGATEEQSVVEVRRTFEELRSIPSGLHRNPTVGDIARDFATQRIHFFEEDPQNPRLSGPARQMLRVPLKEVANIAGDFDQEQIDAALNRLFMSMREPPTAQIEGKGRNRTSLAVIKAFAKNYCRIPPFCAPKT